MDTYLPSKTIINPKTFPKKSLNIAVVGSGIAGLSAAWLLKLIIQLKTIEQFL